MGISCCKNANPVDQAKSLSSDSSSWMPTSEKVYRYAGAIFLFSMITIVIVSVVMKYPAASTTFYSLLSVTAVLSLIAFTVSCIRRQGQADQGSKGQIPNTTAVAVVMNRSTSSSSILGSSTNGSNPFVETSS